jgi:predicted NUDIX family NTP pyrophosphohydrolase
MMSSSEQTDVIIYRVRETGLEVFLVHPSAIQTGTGDEKEAALHIPGTDQFVPERLSDRYIALDPVTDANGQQRNAIAIEADWHEIPSLRALIYEDYRVAKEKARHHLKNILPSMERGAYVAVKEAFRRIMPEQYAFLKELKEIVAEKNQTHYL